MVSVAHKPGAFKQTNHSHKTGKHRSKGAIDATNKGRQTSQLRAVAKSNRKQSKLDRKNRADQIRKHKMQLVNTKKATAGGSVRGGCAPPICVTVLSLDEQSAPAAGLVRFLSGCTKENDATATTAAGIFNHSCASLKSRFQYLTPSSADLFLVLDACKASDHLLLVWPLDGRLMRANQALLTALLAQGVPSIVNIVRGSCALAAKQRPLAKKAILKQLTDRSLEARVHNADTDSEGVQLLRLLLNKKRQDTSLQATRPLLLVDRLVAEVSDSTRGLCSVRLEGYMRGGRPLDVNHLVHVAGWTDLQMDRIEALPDPIAANSRTAVSVDAHTIAVAEPDKRWSLEALAEVDEMNAEQTWPTQEELQEASKARKVRKTVPAGTSEYQASWIPDEDGEEVDDEDDDDDVGGRVDDDESMSADGSADEDMESLGEEAGESSSRVHFSDDVISTAPTTFDRMEDEPIDPKDVELYRQQRQNEMFPDEIDTPIDQDARVRFQKYRGLKSFRTSEWDTKENLPADYARIFQFENFKRAKKRALQTNDIGSSDGDVDPGRLATSGMYVRLHLINVPKLYVDEYASRPRPLLAVGLLPHEQRMSLANVVVRKRPSCKAVLKSKQPVIMQMGYRRFSVAPVYSQHSNGNKHKLERFLPDGASVASFYAPIMYPPAAVLMFHPDTFSLVATGSVLDFTPNRIVVKKIVLSGHPFKIHSKSVVVRYMFFNPADVHWFKPVELRTRYGRRGHIVESLGTHGLMKCRFDGKISQQDSVLMSLYKRVFPKWSFSEHVFAPAAVPQLVEDDRDSDEEEGEDGMQQ